MQSEPFFPIDYQTVKDADDNLVFYFWCLNRKSESVLVKIINYQPTAHLELPDNLSREKIDLIVKYIESKTKWRNKSPTSFKIVEKICLYYYKPNIKTKFILFSFKNSDDIYNLKNLLKNPVNIEGVGTIGLRLWEYDISPIRKFLSLKGCSFSQWFSIEPAKNTQIVSVCKHEYTCTANKFFPIENKISQEWRLYPSQLAIDIETYSPNHNNMPVAVRSTDVVYMVSCIFEHYVNGERKIENYAILYGDCSPVENAEVIKVDDEVELIRQLEALIVRLDPDFVTGYNILYYDYMYLDARLKRNLEEWGVCGRLKNKPSTMQKIIMNTNAFGNNTMYNLSMPGRVNIDLYPIIRFSSYKLDIYKLDFVSKHFLDEQKHDVKAKEMFEIYERTQISSVKDKQRSLDEMAKVLKYCIQDSVLVVKLFHKLGVQIDLIQSSNILGVPIIDIYTKGQQVKCLSQIYDECYKHDIVMDHKDEGTFSYEGGFVNEPEKGLHRNIICLDFASMYPSNMQAYNISYETLVAPEYESMVKDEDCFTFDIESKDLFEPVSESEADDSDSESENTIPVAQRKLRYKFKFVKHSVRKGIIPIIEEKLVSERRLVKKEMKTLDPDSFLYMTLEKRQLALKVASNSVYGFLAAYKLPLIQGAMAITYKGREQIKTVNEFLKKNYPNARIIYNDTDSVFVDMGIEDPIKCLEMGKLLASQINGLFPPPVNIEFEKAMIILNLKKKKYGYRKIAEKDDPKKGIKRGDYEPTINKKGIVTARRDNCKWMRDIYDQCLESILYERSFEHTLNIIFDNVLRLFRKQVDPADMTIIRTLGANYKSENAFMKIFADELRRKGKVVTPGDRLQYILIKNNEELVGKKMILLEDYTNEEIDNLYYLEKLVMNPIEQLLEVAYPKTQHFYFVAKKKKLYVNNVIKMIIEGLKTDTIEGVVSTIKENMKKDRVIYI